MPTPPALTHEQRRAAYEKALELRRRRSDIKGWLARTDRTKDAVLSRLSAAWLIPDVLGMKVIDLLTALPGIGQATAERLLAQAKIPEKNTVRACGPRQRERLFELLSK